MILTDDLVCSRCGLAQPHWKGQNGNGYLRASRNGELKLYCCSGCALNRCTCRTPAPLPPTKPYQSPPSKEQEPIAAR